MWRDHDIVKTALAQAREFIGRDLEFVFSWELNTWADNQRHPLESPIETAFYMWWVAQKITYEHGLKLHPQREVEVWDGDMRRKYRIDFVVESLDPLFDILCEALKCKPLVAIELDGHEFHERTKEQVAARNQRDRALQMSGWKVFHVSGSELFRDGASAIKAVGLAVVPEFSKAKRRIVKELTGQDIEIVE